MNGLLFIGGLEIVFILFVVLLLFGAKSIPDVAKMMGKGLHEFRKASDDIKKEFDKETNEFSKDINDVGRELKK